MQALRTGCLLLSSSVWAGAAPPNGGFGSVIYNYAGVPRPILARAAGETQRIYRRIGVEMRWVECPSTRPWPAACNPPRTLENLEVRLLPRSMAEHARMEGAALGFTFSGLSANVVWERVQEAAANHEVPVGILLGHAVAHEIGHLLLGARAHSSSGLMHEEWSKTEFGLAAQGSLSFLPWDAERIRMLCDLAGQGPAADEGVRPTP